MTTTTNMIVAPLLSNGLPGDLRMELVVDESGAYIRSNGGLHPVCTWAVEPGRGQLDLEVAATALDCAVVELLAAVRAVRPDWDVLTDEEIEAAEGALA